MQKPYTAKPGKILGEQYTTGMALPAGVCTCNLQAVGYEATGHPPHIHVSAGAVLLHETDWLIADRWTGVLTGILTDAQFTETYGSGPNAE